MILYKKPLLCDIKSMQELVRDEVKNGVILHRNDDEIAQNIRSYIAAFGDGNFDENLSQNLDKNSDTSAVSTKISNQNSDANPLRNSSNLARFDTLSLVGYCSLHFHSSNLAEIRSLITSPNYRNQGIGSTLIKELLKEAKSYGVSEVFTLTYKQSFFEKLGFRVINKADIPSQKIWADCIKCKNFPICNEIALIYKF
ncbi:MAG: GNAT family N-acetyltransferase [Campylobacter sp.]|nr:GNAT family N-acetyltransferase [Campylobacter sp.]